LPSPVGGFFFRSLAALQAKLLVQSSDFSDLGPETRNRFSKNLEVIHIL
jgi:hypothetical protein